MNDQLPDSVVEQMLEHTITMDANRESCLHQYRMLLKASLVALFACLVSMPSVVGAEESTQPSPAGDQSKKPVSFTEFARSTAIDIQDVRSKLSAGETNMPDGLSLAVFCSIHQVFEVRSPRRSLGSGESVGLLRQLGAAKP
ncbi:hypothetical protein [Roseibium sp.]|uniref:hypothetical protein n=1 Tax=Roseibium sp. TaxID=1936156 RepID=UPI003D1454D6